MNPSDPSADDDSSSDESVDSSKFQAVESYNASPYNNGSSMEHQNNFHLTGNNYGTHKRKSSYDIVPAKRNRASTYGTSSNTSNGSGQESDDDPPEASDFDGYREESHYSTKTLSGYRKQSSDDNIRLSRSSVSEARSSPIDQFEAGKTGFEENDTDNGEDFARPSFQSPDSFYNRNSKEIEEELPSGYSEKSKRMMSNMGYKPGRGLGKHESGRTEPVEASTQKGRRGLGLEPSVVGEIPQDFQWGPDSSRPDALEKLEWLPCKEEPLSIDELEEWLQKGQKKLTLNDETYFVKESVLKGVLDAKTIFDSLDDKDLRNARFRSNPYETIGSVIFINRAAVKMANIDSICDFMFTKPKDKHGNNMLHDTKDILYFADVCAGPGGFSEYVLYRKGWNSKGFGFTLTGPCDFKLSDFFAGTPETFNAYYGVKEDGNIFDPENLDSLKNYVLTQTEDRGVHFLMADGGFSVVGQENIQEILSKQLYLCQCLAALMLVRTGGHFVVKLFDVFTPFSVGLLYIMYRCFDEVSIHKPVTSRPANSERYLICKWKKSGTEATERHLFNVNEMLCDAESSGDDVTQLVPLTVMQKDKKFFEYIYQSNNVIGERQIKNLLKIAAYSKDKNLTESTQAEIKEQCLRLWKLPDQSRKCPSRMNPDDTLMTIISSMEQAPPDSQSPIAFKTKTLNKPPTYLTNQSELPNFGNVYDWHFMFLNSCRSSSELRIFLGCGNRHVYKFENSTWMSVSGITLPPKTLIYGEIVREYQGVGTMQMFTKSLHIVDGLMLGGVDISTLPLSKRLRQCSLFCTALDKPFDREAIPIRCKSLFEMEKFDSALKHLELRTMKSVKKAVTIDIPNRSIRVNKFYAVGSMMFIKEIKEPWVAQLSRTNGVKYYFRMGPDKKPQSEYFIPNGAQLDMLNGYLNRVMWSWGDGAPAFLEGRPCSGISRKDMQDYIANKTA